MQRSRRGWPVLCFTALLLVSCSTISARHGLRTPPLDPTSGWYFEVKVGDSLETIAQVVGQAVEKLATDNNLGNPATLYDGMLLWIPPKVMRQPAATTKNRYEPMMAVASADRNRGPLPLDPGVAGPHAMNIEGASVLSHSVQKPVRRAGNADKLGFRWPVDPGLCQTVPTKGGLDLVTAEGTPIAASRSGKVMSSGALRGLGNLVLIDHGDGYITVYAHMKKSVVTEKQRVKRGQVIGYVGSTDAEKSKLYFEIRKGSGSNYNAIEPMQYLP